mmetsp:Transcript_9351/g.28173  ORF Transcript_9351/g.28173 Transcript_9351/m.28173 type:complete len:181 (+) Transcript_9351:65-607(+)
MEHSPKGDFYLQKQRLFWCAVHTANALLQRDCFSYADFEAICSELAPERRWLNPHRMPLGLGNYDVNVLSIALQRHGVELVWHDSREPLSTISFRSPRFMGLVLNETRKRLAGLFTSKHWYCIRKAQNDYVLLDSVNDKPVFLNIVQIMDKLRTVLEHGGHVLVALRVEHSGEIVTSSAV